MTEEEKQRIGAALAQAQAGTTGKIAVRVINDRTVDAFERAKREFLRTGLHRHPAGNAALVLVAPDARQFAVLGDKALHERVGDAFWQGIVEESRPYFAAGDTIGGITHAIERIGEALHAHFSK